MSPDDYQRLRALFDNLASRSRQERQQRIDAEFPKLDDPLRKELVEWLESVDELVEEDAGPEVTQVHPGRLVSGRYRIDKLLGQGGFARTYLARDEQLHHKTVVLKSPLPVGGKDREWFERHFVDEVRALAALNHPGIVQVLDSGKDPEFGAYFVLQYIEGPSLRGLLEKGPLETGRAMRLLQKVALGLAAAHERGIIHRDLKPENILIRAAGTPEEAPVLIDFGIASVKEADEGRTTLTTRIVGSESYLAPEQAQGHVSRRTDIYSLGGIAIELLTGRVLNRELKGRRPERVAEELLTAKFGRKDSAWIQPLARLVSLDSADRPDDAAEVARLFSGKGSSRRQWLGIAAATGATAAVSAGFWIFRPAPPSAPAPAPQLVLRIRAIRQNGEILSLEGGIVTQADKVNLQCSLSESAYLTVWAQSSDSPREISLLYPGKVPHTAVTLINIPAAFDDRPERIRIWVFASRKPQKEWEALTAEALASEAKSAKTPSGFKEPPQLSRLQPDGSYAIQGTESANAAGWLDHRKL